MSMDPPEVAYRRVRFEWQPVEDYVTHRIANGATAGA